MQTPLALAIRNTPAQANARPIAAELQPALIVADGCAPELRELLAASPLRCLWVDARQDAMQWLSTALAGERLDVLHLVAHGRSGGFSIGGCWVDAAALRAHAALLQHWQVARIVLWSCEAGADSDFTSTLSRLTGAQVLASSAHFGTRGGVTQWGFVADATTSTAIGAPVAKSSLQIDASSVFSAASMAAWPHALGLLTVSFGSGFIGANTGSNSSNPAYSFSEMGWTNVQFSQTSSTNVFVAQGNDIIGNVLITDKNGVQHTIPGFIMWRTPSGNSPSTMVFQPSSTYSLATDNVGTYTNTTYSIDPYVDNSNRGDYIGLTFNGQTLSFTNGGSVTGNAATNGLLDALNTYLAAQPQLSVNDQTVSEGAGTVTFTVTLSSASADTITVKYETHDGTASAGSDYTAVSTGTLTFNAGETTKTVVVNITDDGNAESSENLSLLLHDPTFAAISDDTGVATITDNDGGATPGITLGSISGHTTEAGGTATFTVELDSAPAQNVTIAVSSSNSAEGTVSSSTLTFTPANWNTPQTVTVTGVDDSVVDGNVNYQVDLASASSDSSYNNLTTSRAVTNDDNDSASLSLSAISRHTTEAGQTATFTVKLASQPTQSVKVGVSSSNTAEGTVDTSSLTFTTANWNTPQTITVTGVDDFSIDGNANYQIDLASSSTDNNYNNLTANRSVTNDDDDSATLVLGAISRHTTEAGQTATFTVKLGSQPAQGVTVGVSSSNTAEGTVDASSLSFSTGNWNTPQTITITGVDDSLDDGDIAYQIDLLSSSADNSYDKLSTNRAVTNDDDDTAGLTLGSISRHTTEAGQTATFSVKLASQPTQDVKVGVSSSNTAEGTVDASSLTFTAANWNTPQTITVTGVDDSVDDGDIAYQIDLASTSSDGKYNSLTANRAVTNDNNDTAGLTLGSISRHTTEAGQTATFTVKLATQPTQDVKVGVSSSNTAEGTVDASSLTFTTANWNTPQTITVTGVDDSVDDGDIAYQIDLATTSTDGKYNSLTANRAVTNDNNDTAGLTLGAISRHTTEAGQTATFTVKLATQPTQDVKVGVSSSNTAEGTVDASSLTFTTANWNTPQTITITGVDDFIDDGDIAYQIDLASTSTDSKYNSLTDNRSVTNDDDDAAGLVLGVVSSRTTENGNTAHFTVKLASQPTQNVSVALTSSNVYEGALSVNTLSFTPGNWNTPQTVTVTGMDDLVADGDTEYQINLVSSSADNGYNQLSDRRILTNSDNDTAGLVLSSVNRHTSEAGQTASFTVKLASQPMFDVTVMPISSNTAEGKIASGALTFTRANWNQPQTVTVTGVDDTVDDGSIDYSVELQATSSDSGYNGRNGSRTLTNDDNDAGGLVIGSVTGHTSESGQSTSFTVQLASKPEGDVSVAVASSDITEGRLVTSNLVFTAANWNQPQTVTVDGVDDLLDDGDISYQVSLAASSTDAGYNGLSASRTVVNDDNDDPAGLVLGAVSRHTTEAGQTASFTVKLASKPVGDVTLALSSSDSTEGTVGADALTFTAANWDTPQTVTVTGADDSLLDGNIAYRIDLLAHSTDANYNGLAGQRELVNDDDDNGGLVIGNVVGRTAESGQSTSFTVKLGSQPTQNVSIAVASSDTTEGTVGSSTLSFTPANWNTPQTVTVTGVDDLVDDGDISYQVTLASTSGDAHYNGLSGSRGIVNLNDDHAGLVLSSASRHTNESGVSATFDVRLSTAPSTAVAVTVQSANTSEGTATPTVLNFSPDNWNTPQTVTVTGVDDTLADGDIAYEVQLTANSGDSQYQGRTAAAALVNDDNEVAGLFVGSISGHTRESGESAQFSVSLANQPAAPVTITVQNLDTTEGQASPVTLVFTPSNWQQPQTVLVKGVDDTEIDGDIAYQLKLSSTSTDAHYDGLVAMQTVVNDDDDGAQLLISRSQLNTAEDGRSDSFTVQLSSRPSSPVTINIANGNTSEGKPSTGTLQFDAGNWNQPQTVTVAGVNDDKVDGDQSYALQLSASSADSHYQGRSASIGVVNADDDRAGLVLGSINRHTNEDGQTASFTVVLSSQPSTEVVVAVASSDATEGSVSPLTLRFNASNWQQPQTLTVSGLDDVLVDGAVVYDIQLRASAGDPAYDGRLAAVAVTNDDNDSSGLLLDKGQLITGEDGRSDSVHVRLSSQPTAPVVLTVATTNAAEGQAGTSTLTFTPVNWNQAQTVNVSGLDDDRVDGDVLHNLLFTAHSADTSYEGETAAVPVRNADNDHAALVVTGAAGQHTSEDGAAAHFTVQLSSRPDATVIVSLGSTHTGEGRPGAAQLVFTPDNWNKPQPVTVNGIDDALFDGDTPYALSLSASSSDPHYQGLQAREQLVNDDNEKVADNTPPEFGVPVDTHAVPGDTARVLDPQGHVIGDRLITPDDIAAGKALVLPDGLDDGVYTFITQVVDPSGEVKAQAPITVTVVTDRDGVAPSTERAARDGDGNHDGVADWQQNNVTLLPMASAGDFRAGAAAPSASFGVVMVGTPTGSGAAGAVKLDGGGQLQDLGVSEVGSGAGSGLPASSPRLNFTVAGQTDSLLADADPARPGLQTQVVIDLPPGASGNAVYLFNNETGHWVEMPTRNSNANAGSSNALTGGDSAQLVDTNGDGRPDRVVLMLTDGGKFDSGNHAGGGGSDAGGGIISASVALGQHSNMPVYSVLLGDGDRFLTTNAREAATMAAGPDARFEGVAFDSLDAASGGQALHAYHQPFTIDWNFGSSDAAMPYACYELMPAMAGFSAAPSSVVVGEGFHLYLNNAGRTQLATTAMAAQLGLSGQGYQDLGVRFNTTRETAFSFDPEGYLIANRDQPAVQTLVQTLAKQFGSASNPGFVEAVEQHYLTQAVLMGLPHGDAASVAQLNAAFGTGFGA